MAFMQILDISLKDQFDQIESIRTKKKISIENLCLKSKVHQSTYYRIKKNKVSAKYETIQKFIKALNDQN
jgi:predicted transcriptional regulator